MSENAYWSAGHSSQIVPVQFNSEELKVFALLREGNLETGINDDCFLMINSNLKRLSPQFYSQCLAICPSFFELAFENNQFRVCQQLGGGNWIQKAKIYIELMMDSQLEEVKNELRSSGKEVEYRVVELLHAKKRGDTEIAAKNFDQHVAPFYTAFSYEVKSVLGYELFVVFSSQGRWQEYLSYGEELVQLHRSNGRRGPMLSACFSLMAGSQSMMRNDLREFYGNQLNELRGKYRLGALDRILYVNQMNDYICAQQYQEAVDFFESLTIDRKYSPYQLTNIFRLYTWSLVEVGRCREADYFLGRTRKLWQEYRWGWLNIYQIPIEILRKSLTTEAVNLASAVSTFRGDLNNPIYDVINFTMLRIFRSQGKVDKVEGILNVYRKIKDRWDISLLIETDIDVTALNGTNSITARAREQLIFAAIRTKDPVRWVEISQIKEIQSPVGPWDNCLSLLTKICMENQRTIKNRMLVLELAEKGLLLSESNGLDRMTAIFLALLASVEARYLDDWAKLLSRLENGQQIEILEVIQSLGIHRNLGPSMMIHSQSGSTRASVAPVEMIQKADLVLDFGSRQVLLRKLQSPLGKSFTLMKLLAEVLKARAAGATKEELVRAVWGQEYDPIRHDSLIHTSVGRLRKFLTVNCVQGRFYMVEPIQWIIIEPSNWSPIQKQLDSRHQEILKLFDKHRSFISRADVVKSLEISERTALRELTELVRLSVLEKHGQGRAVSYSLNAEFQN